MKLRRGMRVTTGFHPREKAVVRTITYVQKASTRDYGSGAWASADGGVPCPTCGHVPGTPIEHVDSVWFEPVEED